MKKIALSLLALVMILCVVCSCGKNTPDQAKAEESTTVDPQYQLTAQIDYSNPIVETDKKEYRNIYEVDGIAHDNTYVVPHLNIGLTEAIQINNEIDQYFTDNFSIHFAMLEDVSNEKVHSGEKCLNVSYSYAIDHDVVSIVIIAEESYPPSEPTYTYKVFHWDALADIELSVVEYMEYNRISLQAVSDALEEKDILLTEDSSGIQLSDVVYIEESNTYDIYLLMPNGTMTKINLNLEKAEAPSVPNPQ